VPILPVYNSNRNIQAIPIAAQKDDARQFGENVDVVLSTMDKIRDANDTMQYSRAKAEYLLETQRINAEATADPDYNNSGKYLSRLDKIKSTILSRVDNLVVRNNLSMEMDYDNQVSAIKINSHFKAKEIEDTKYKLSKGVAVLQQQKVFANSQDEKDKNDFEIKKLLSMNVYSGIISSAEADKMYKDTQKTAIKYDIYADLSTSEDESKVLNELRDPNGSYKDIDSDTRLSLIEESQRRIFQNNQTLKKATEASQLERTDRLIDKFLDGTVTFEDIDQEIAIPEDQGGMPRNIILKYQKAIQSGVGQSLNKMLQEKNRGRPTERAKKVKSYNDLIDIYVNDDVDQWKAKEALVDAWADGNIDASEKKFLNDLRKMKPGVQDAIRESIKTIRGLIDNMRDK
jgi:hypothetical protein